MTAYKAKTWDGSQWVDIGSNSIDSSTFATKSYVASAVPGRNLLHNGAMQIHQRGTSTASITATGYYTADRWQLGISALGTWTQSVENDAPSGSGFRKSLKMLCTTDDASPAASDLLFVTQSIEGQNLQSIKKGTADAQPLTLSFWVKSNKTGTYVVEILDADTGGLRHVSATYTVSSSGTWEQKTITFPADTTGVLDNDNAASLQLSFWLASGSTYTSGTLPTSWAAYTAANRAVGQTNLASAINNYIQFTGVQLETGSTATSYNFKGYETELAECQRYYWSTPVGGAYAYIVGAGPARTTTNATIDIVLPTAMRGTQPTIGLAGGSLASYYGATSQNVTAIAFNGAAYALPDRVTVDATVASGLSAGTWYRLTISGAGNYMSLSADL